MLRLATLVLVVTVAACGQMRGARALPALPRGATAQVAEDNYLVDGNTIDQIRASLGASRGYHRWNLRYRYSCRPSGGICEMTDVTIDLESTIVVPRWTGRATASVAVITLWDRYITVLRSHEYTHREYSYRAARDISRTLLDLTTRDCAGMQQLANSNGQRILDRYRRLNSEFDEESRGTITWPPRPGSR
jgi:predicted secreted Zn-dependent protease